MVNLLSLLNKKHKRLFTDGLFSFLAILFGTTLKF